MRLFNMALALLVLTASTVANAADDATTPDGAQASFDAERKNANSANDPTEPRLTVEYWNFYAPSLHKLNGGAENGEGRILIPFEIEGVQQIMHIVPFGRHKPDRENWTAYWARRHPNLQFHSNQA